MKTIFHRRKFFLLMLSAMVLFLGGPGFFGVGGGAVQAQQTQLKWKSGVGSDGNANKITFEVEHLRLSKAEIQAIIAGNLDMTFPERRIILMSGSQAQRNPKPGVVLLEVRLRMPEGMEATQNGGLSWAPIGDYGIEYGSTGQMDFTLRYKDGEWMSEGNAGYLHRPRYAQHVPFGSGIDPTYCGLFFGNVVRDGLVRMNSGSQAVKPFQEITAANGGNTAAVGHTEDFDFNTGLTTVLSTNRLLANGKKNVVIYYPVYIKKWESSSGYTEAEYWADFGIYLDLGVAPNGGGSGILPIDADDGDKGLTSNVVGQGQSLPGTYGMVFGLNLAGSVALYNAMDPLKAVQFSYYNGRQFQRGGNYPYQNPVVTSYNGGWSNAVNGYADGGNPALPVHETELLRSITGGITLVAGPTNELVLADTACAGADLSVSFKSQSMDRLERVRVVALPAGGYSALADKDDAGAWTGSSALLTLYDLTKNSGTWNPSGTPNSPNAVLVAGSESIADNLVSGELTISKAVLVPGNGWDGYYLAVISEDESGAVTMTRFNAGSPYGVLNSDGDDDEARIRVPVLPTDGLLSISPNVIPRLFVPASGSGYVNGVYEYTAKPSDVVAFRYAKELSGGVGAYGSELASWKLKSFFQDGSEKSDYPVSGVFANGVSITQGADFIAEPMWFTGYSCPGPSDTIRVVMPPTLEIKGGQMCPDVAYGGMTVQFFVPTVYEPLGLTEGNLTPGDATAKLSFELQTPAGVVEGAFDGDLITYGGTSGFLGSLGLIPYELPASLVKSAYNGYKLIVLMEVGGGGQPVSEVRDTLVLAVETGYASGFEVILDGVSTTNLPQACSDNTITYDFSAGGSGNPFLTIDIYAKDGAGADAATLEDASNVVMTGVGTVPFSSYYLMQNTQFLVVGVSPNGCRYRSEVKDVEASCSSVTSYKNLLGNITCVDTLVLQAEIPIADAADNNWHWIFSDMFHYYEVVSAGGLTATEKADYPNLYELAGSFEELKQMYIDNNMGEISSCEEVGYVTVGSDCYMDYTVFFTGGTNTNLSMLNHADYKIENSADGTKSVLKVWAKTPAVRNDFHGFLQSVQDGMAYITAINEQSRNNLKTSDPEMGVLNLTQLLSYGLMAPGLIGLPFYTHDAGNWRPDQPIADLWIEQGGDNSPAIGLTDASVLMTMDTTFITNKKQSEVYNEWLTLYNSGYDMDPFTPIRPDGVAGDDWTGPNYNVSLQYSANGTSWTTLPTPAVGLDKFQSDYDGTTKLSNINNYFRLHYAFDGLAASCRPRDAGPVVVRIASSDDIGTIRLDSNENDPVPVNAMGNELSICGEKDVTLIKSADHSGITHFKYEYLVSGTTWAGVSTQGVDEDGNPGNSVDPDGFNLGTNPPGLAIPAGKISALKAADGKIHLRLIGQNSLSTPDVFFDTSNIVIINLLPRPVSGTLVVPSDTCSGQLSLSYSGGNAGSGATFGNLEWYQNNLLGTPGKVMSPYDGISAIWPDAALSAGSGQRIWAKIFNNYGCWDTVRKPVNVVMTPVFNTLQLDSCHNEDVSVSVSTVYPSPSASSEYAVSWWKNAGGGVYGAELQDGVDDYTMQSQTSLDSAVLTVPASSTKGDNARFEQPLIIKLMRKAGPYCWDTVQKVLVVQYCAPDKPDLEFPASLVAGRNSDTLCEGSIPATGIVLKLGNAANYSDLGSKLLAYRVASSDIDLATVSGAAWNSAHDELTLPQAYFGAVGEYKFVFKYEQEYSDTLALTIRTTPVAGVASLADGTLISSDTTCKGGDFEFHLAAAQVGNFLTLKKWSDGGTVANAIAPAKFPASIVNSAAGTGPWHDSLYAIYSNGGAPGGTYVCSDTTAVGLVVLSPPVVFLDRGSSPCRYDEYKVWVTNHVVGDAVQWECDQGGTLSVIDFATQSADYRKSANGDTLYILPDFGAVALQVRATVTNAGGCNGSGSLSFTSSCTSSTVLTLTPQFACVGTLDSITAKVTTNRPIQKWEVQQSGNWVDITADVRNVSGNVSGNDLEFRIPVSKVGSGAGPYPIRVSADVGDDEETFMLYAVPGKPKLDDMSGVKQADSAMCDVAGSKVTLWVDALSSGTTVKVISTAVPAAFPEKTWTPGTNGKGTVVVNWGDLVASAPKAGVYKFKIVSTNPAPASCADTSMEYAFSVKAEPAPIDFVKADSICQGSTTDLYLGTPLGNGESIAWFYGTGAVPSTDITASVVAGSNPLRYEYTPAAGEKGNKSIGARRVVAGCTSAIAVKPFVIQDSTIKPTVSPAENTVCYGTQVVSGLGGHFNSTPTVPNERYQWFFRDEAGVWTSFGSVRTSLVDAKSEFTTPTNGAVRPYLTDTTWLVLEVTYGLCPMKRAEKKINVLSEIPTPAVADTMICEGDGLIEFRVISSQGNVRMYRNGVPNPKYTQSGDLVAVSNLATLVVGDYTYRAFESFSTPPPAVTCQSDTIDVKLTVNAIPGAPTLLKIDTICEGSSAELRVSTSGLLPTDSLVWLAGGAVISPQPTRVSATEWNRYVGYTPSGTGTLTITAKVVRNGCESSASTGQPLYVQAKANSTKPVLTDIDFCYNAVPRALTSTDLTGAGSEARSFLWQLSTDKQVSFANHGTATATQAAAIAMYNSLNINALTDTLYYKLTINYGYCPSQADTMRVSPALPVAMPTGLKDTTICETPAGTVLMVAKAPANLSVYVYRTPAYIASFGKSQMIENPVGSGSYSLSITGLKSADSPHGYRVFALNSAGCSSDTTAGNTITVSAPVVSGTVKAADLCQYQPTYFYVENPDAGHDKIEWYDAAGALIHSGSTVSGFKQKPTLSVTGDTLHFPVQWALSSGSNVTLKARVYVGACYSEVTQTFTENGCAAPALSFNVDPSLLCDGTDISITNIIGAPTVWKLFKKSTVPTATEWNTAPNITTDISLDGVGGGTLPYSRLTAEYGAGNEVGRYHLQATDGITTVSTEFTVVLVPQTPVVVADNDPVCEGSPVVIDLKTGEAAGSTHYTDIVVIDPDVVTGTVQLGKVTVQGSGTTTGSVSVATGGGANQFKAPDTYGYWVFATHTQGALTCYSDTVKSGEFRVKAIPPKPEIDDLDSICFGTGATAELKLSSVQTPYDNLGGVKWYLNGSTTELSTTKVDDQTYTYDMTSDAAGSYTFRATVTVEGCTSPLSDPKVMKIMPQPVKPLISGASMLCEDGTMDALTLGNAAAVEATNSTEFQWIELDKTKTVSTLFGANTAGTGAAANAEFATALATKAAPAGYPTADTTYFTIEAEYGVCGTLFGDTVMVVVRPQPQIGEIDLNDLIACKAALTGDEATVDGLLNADKVSWYRCYSTSGWPLPCTPTSGAIVNHINMLGQTEDKIDIGLNVNADGYYIFRAVAGIDFTGKVQAAAHGCVDAVSDSLRVEVVGGIKSTGLVSFNRDVVCENDSTMAFFAKKPGDFFHSIQWQVSADNQSSWTDLGSLVAVDPDKDSIFAVMVPDIEATSGTRYFVRANISVSDPACGANIAITGPFITVNDSSWADTIQPMFDTVCIGTDNQALTLPTKFYNNPHITVGGGYIQWYDSACHAGAASNARNVGATYAAATIKVSEKTAVWAMVKNGVCPPVRSEVAIIDTFARAIAGDLGAIDPQCAAAPLFTLDSTNNAPLNAKGGLYAPQVLSVRWQRSATGTAPWTTFNDPKISTAPYGNVDGTVYYRAIVYNSNQAFAATAMNVCPGDTSAAVAVVFNKQITGNVEIDPSVICSGADVKLHYKNTTAGAAPTAFSILNWYADTAPYADPKAITYDCGSCSKAIDTTVSVEAASATTKYRFYAQAQNGVCPPIWASSPELTVNEKSEPADIATPAQDTVCSSGGAGRTDITLTLADPGKGVVTWELIDTATDAVTYLGAGSSYTVKGGSALFPASTTGLDTFYLVRVKTGVLGSGSTAGCVNEYSDTVTVKVMTAPVLTTTAAQVAATDICISEPSMEVKKASAATVKGHWQWYGKFPGQADYTALAGASGTNPSTDVSPFVKPNTATDPFVADNYSFQLKAYNTNRCDTLSTTPVTIRVWDTIQIGTIAPTDTTVCQYQAVGFTATGTNFGANYDPAKVVARWLVRLPGGSWSTGVGTATISGDRLSGKLNTPSDPIYEVVLTLANPGCQTADTSNIAVVRTSKAPNKPTLKVSRPVVCEEDTVLITVGNLTVGDSLEISIYTSTSLTGDPALILAKVTAPTMVFSSNKIPSGSDKFRARAFVPKMYSNPCGYALSDEVTVNANDSSDAGNLKWTCLPSLLPDVVCNDLERSGVAKGDNSGAMTTDGLYTPGVTTLVDEMDQVLRDGTHAPLPYPQTSWSSTNYSGRTVSYYDTVYFRLIAENQACPPDTSNWIKLTLKDLSGISLLANPTEVCVAGGKSQVSAAITGSVTITNESWERIVYEEDGTTLSTDPAIGTNPNLSYRAITDLSGRTFQAVFSELTDVSGWYAYVYHCLRDGIVYSDTVRVRVDAPTIAGTVVPVDSVLCQDGTAPELILSGNLGEVKTWEFAPATGVYGSKGLPMPDSTRLQTGNQPADSGSYRVVVQNGVCPSATTDPVKVHVIHATDPGTIIVPPVPCYNGCVEFETAGHTGFVIDWMVSETRDPDDITVHLYESMGSTDNPLQLCNLKTEVCAYAILQNSGLGLRCKIEHSDPVCVLPYDTLEFKELVRPQIPSGSYLAVRPDTTVEDAEPQILLEVLAEGFYSEEAGLFPESNTTIPAANTGYQWYYRDPTSTNPQWIAISESNGWGITNVKTEILTIPATHYKDPAYEDWQYSVRSFQIAPSVCSDTVDLYVGAIEVMPPLAIDAFDPRCLFLGDTTTIFPAAIAGVVSGGVSKFEWFYTPVGGGAEVQVDASQTWAVGRTDTAFLNVDGILPLQDGDQIRLKVTDYYGNEDSETYIVCLSEKPIDWLLPNDTVCVNDFAEFTLSYTFAEPTDRLQMAWYRVAAGGDTLAITASKIAGSAQNADGTTYSGSGVDALANYALVNEPLRNVVDANRDFVSTLRYTGSTLGMKGYRYIVKITSSDVQLDPPPVYLEAELTVVDSIRIDPNYPADDTICHLTTATLVSNIITDKTNYETVWMKYNPTTGLFDTVQTKQGGDSLVGKDTLVTEPLPFDPLALPYQYYYQARNICNSVDSRTADIEVRALPQNQLNVDKPLELCEDDELIVRANRTNPVYDTLVWYAGKPNPYPGGDVRHTEVQPYFTAVPGLGYMFFVFDQDSISKAIGQGWNDVPAPQVLGVTQLENGMVITAKIADRRCMNPEAWIADSTVIQIKDKALYDHPQDIVTVYNDAKVTTNTQDTIYFNVATSSDPSNQYRWYWTGENHRPSHRSYDELTASGKTADQMNLALDQPEALGWMTPVPATGLDPRFIYVDSSTLGVVINTSNYESFDSVMFACEVTSSACGGLSIDTSFFARLTILQDTLAIQGMFRVEQICTDNWSVQDSIIINIGVNKPKAGMPVSYQWEYWDGNPDVVWVPLDRRKYKNTNKDTVTILPVFSNTNQYWFRCKLNNSVYSDTIEIKINYMPYFSGGNQNPLSRMGSTLVWPELTPLPDEAGIKADPANVRYITRDVVGFPADRDDAGGLVYQGMYPWMVSLEQLDSNIVIYNWFRAEKNSNDFQPSVGQHLASSSGDEDLQRWTLFHQQTRLADDSIRIAVQLSNLAGCPGESDTVMIIVPKCHIDSITMQPEPVCEGGMVEFKVWPQTDQEYVWYKRKNTTVWEAIAASTEFELRDAGTTLRISEVMSEMDSTEFTCVVKNAYCDINSSPIQQLLIERIGIEKLYITSDLLENDTITMTAGESTTELEVEPYHADPMSGFNYEWFTIPPVDDPTDFAFGASGAGVHTNPLSFVPEYDLHQLFVKVTTPSGCETQYTDTIVLRMNAKFEVILEEESLKYCAEDVGGHCFTTHLDPADPEPCVSRYEWHQRLNNGITWNIVVPSPTNFVVGGAEADELCFARLNNNYKNSTFRVVAFGCTPGVMDTSDPVQVIANSAIDMVASNITRNPSLGAVVCLPNDGATLTYTANAYSSPAGSTNFEYTFEARKLVDGAYEFPDDYEALPISQKQRGASNQWSLAIDPSFHLALVTVKANLASCGDVLIGVDTIKLQPVDSINIQIDTTVLCSTQPVRFNLHQTPEFPHRIAWETPLETQLTSNNNKTSIAVNLPEGTHKVAVYVYAQAPGGYPYGCETYDTVEVNVKAGTPFDLHMNGEKQPGDYLFVEVNNAVELEIIPLANDGITPLQGSELDGMGYRWTVLNHSDLPVLSPNEKITLTSTYDDLLPIPQRIVGQLIDLKGCVSLDTATIEVGGAFALDSVNVADRFRNPFGGEEPRKDTTFEKELNQIIGQLELCGNNVFYLTPYLSGGHPQYTYHWTFSEDVYLFDQQGQPLDGGALLTKGTTWTSNPMDSLNMTLGILPVSDNDNIQVEVFAEDRFGEETSITTITAEITLNYLPDPYIKMHLEPRTYGNRYYHNQAVYYHLGPDRYENYTFYRFVRPEGELDYVLTPDSTEVGAKNPVRDSLSVFGTAFVEGEEENLVLGVARRADGCQAWDTVSVQLVPLPNVVIPDDELHPMNRVFLPDFDVEVYDSWGLKIKDYGTKGWDATYKGKKIRSGTYYYNAKVPTPEGFYIISGAVTVLRSNPNDN